MSTDGLASPRPSVSVCLPAYQAERYLGATIASVLSQTWTDFELVVLDNASTDGTARILRGFRDPRIRVLRNHTTVPIADNWNRVVQHSRGELVKVLCADDLLHPQALELQVRALQADPALAVVASRRDLVDQSGRAIARGRGLYGLLGRHDERAVVRKVVRNGANPIGEAVAVMFRRAHFDAVGGLDGRLVFPMDLDLWLKLLRHGQFLGIDTSLAAFRVHGDSLSATARRGQYREQRAFTQQLVNCPDREVPASDALIGSIRAPFAMLRRRTLFSLARLRTRT